MKRTLALILSLLMVATLCVAIVSAEEEVATIDLLPGKDATWTKNDHIENTINIDGNKFVGERKTEADTWPSVKHTYASAIKVAVDDYALEFDFTVSGEYDNSRGAIVFYFNDPNTGYHLGNDVVKKSLGIDTGKTAEVDGKVVAVDENGNKIDNDFRAGNYKGTVKLSDLMGAKDYDWGVAWSNGKDGEGNLTISDLTVFACGGATVTINSLKLVPANAAEEPKEEIKTWKETESIDENGVYSYGTAYDYDFNISRVNGSVVAEGGLIITKKESFDKTTQWSPNVELKKVEDNKYEVVQVIVGKGPEHLEVFDALKWDEGNIVMAIHSAGSKPKDDLGEYPNYEQKVVAIALKAGDIVTLSGIDLTKDGDLDPAGKAHVEVPSADDEPKTPVEPKDDYEQKIKEFNGEKNDPAEFELEITTTGDYKAGSIVKVTVTLKNVTHGEGISILSFDLGYDKDSLEFTNYEFEKLNVYNEETKQREEVQGALILDTTGSRLTEDNGKWESVSGFDEEKPGVIHVSYATEKDAEEFMAKNDGDIVLNFEFKVKENAGKEAGLWIANDTVTATDWIMNGDEHTFAGNGNYAILTAEEADKPVDDTTTEPTPGDSTVSVVVLAIIALVAVAGSAVVIKKRG